MTPDTNSLALPSDICTQCGACCANYRVAFYWQETDAAPGGEVPDSYTEKLDDWRVCMIGTRQKPVRCTALQGEIGVFVRCAIYDRRPSPCRHFGLQWEDGHWTLDNEQLKRCNTARKRWRLAPIAP
jgi:Fe-S-cluster containining protein